MAPEYARLIGTDDFVVVALQVLATVGWLLLSIDGGLRLQQVAARAH
jgi:hypothetical protein